MKTRDPGGRVPFSNFTVPRIVPVPKLKTTRRSDNDWPACSSSVRVTSTPSRSPRVIDRPLTSGLPTEERYKFALPGRRPLMEKLPSPAIKDEPELKVCGFEVELTVAVT